MNAVIASILYGLLGIALLILGAVVLIVVVYNRLVALRNRTRNAWAQIDVQLKRRYDLVPNLVESVKAYLKHEAQTLEAVIAARGNAQNAAKLAAAHLDDPAALARVAAAESALKSSIMQLFAVAESYPELKADAQIRALMEELTSTENRIAFARQGYNDLVMEFNTATEQFPNNVVAGMFRFHPAQLLEATESAAERKAVKVSFQ